MFKNKEIETVLFSKVHYILNRREKKGIERILGPVYSNLEKPRRKKEKGIDKYYQEPVKYKLLSVTETVTQYPWTRRYRTWWSSSSVPTLIPAWICIPDQLGRVSYRIPGQLGPNENEILNKKEVNLEDGLSRGHDDQV